MTTKNFTYLFRVTKINYKGVFMGKIIPFERVQLRGLSYQFCAVQETLKQVETTLAKNPKDRDTKKQQKALLIRKSEIENEVQKLTQQLKNSEKEIEKYEKARKKKN